MPWQEIILKCIVIAMSLGILVFVKWLVWPRGQVWPNDDGFFALEVTVLLVLLATFLHGELFRFFDRLRGGGQSTTDHIRLSFWDIVKLMFALFASLAIYKAFARTSQ